MTYPDCDCEHCRLKRFAPEMREILKVFLGHDERFQISIGGNPNAIDKMLAEARRVLSAVSSQQGNTP